jgi:hypothetical protein
MEPGDHRRRRSTTPPADASRRQFFSQRRLVQTGSVAAALGSILGLVFTVGDRARGYFERDEGTGVQIERVALETSMPLRTYFKVRENRDDVRGLGFTEEELDKEVLIVDYDVRFEGGSKGVEYLFNRALQRRDVSGRITTVGAPRSDPRTLDADDDQCGCTDYFFFPDRGAMYRVVVEIRRPNAPSAEPLDRGESNWYTP